MIESRAARHPWGSFIHGSATEISEIFEPASVQRLVSRRLRFFDVNWQKAIPGTARVMAPSGTLDLNVWTYSPEDVSVLIDGFSRAGFQNVKNLTSGYGPGTVITGIWPK